MKTIVVKPGDMGAFKEAAQALASGQLVIFPTETVYGLGANAHCSQAINEVYRCKGRPHDNPLIVHLTELDQLSGVAVDVPDLAYRLFEQYSPGPLTLVLKRNPAIPAEVSAGLETVAVRFPEHPVARQLIEMANCPTVAPSANLSGKPSPTCLAHALEDMDGRVPYIIDGGPCAIGLESTVIDLLADQPTLLRPGAITGQMLAADLGIELLDQPIVGKGPVRAPGMKYRHYAPKAEVMIIEQDQADAFFSIAAESCYLHKQDLPDLAVGLYVPDSFLQTDAYKQFRSYLSDQAIGLKDLGFAYRDVAEASQGLFAAFRAYDLAGCQLILAAEESTVGLGLAYMNRLGKAASKK